MKPLHSLPPDAPVRRVAEWIHDIRWQHHISLLIIMVACEELGIPAGSAHEIEQAMIDYKWINWCDGYDLDPELFGNPKGLSECPHCRSKLWPSEHEDVKQRKERLDREDRRRLGCFEPAEASSVSMMAREDEEIIPKP